MPLQSRTQFLEQTQVEIVGDPVKAAHIQRLTGRVCLAGAWAADLAMVVAAHQGEIQAAGKIFAANAICLGAAAVLYYAAHRTEQQAGQQR